MASRFSLSRIVQNVDEPTSGLDSTAATSLVETLRSLADSGKTIIAVIHQPSQHVFAAFDDLLLVSEGKQMYFGEIGSVRKYMDFHVTKAPAEMGTAEHILDCISKARMFGESVEEAEERLLKLATLARSENFDIGEIGGELKRYSGDGGRGPRAGIFVQFKLLLRRAFRENFRSKAKLIIQTVQQVSLGLIYGGIYTMGTNQVSFYVVSAISMYHALTLFSGVDPRSFWYSFADCDRLRQHGHGVYAPSIPKRKGNHLHRVGGEIIRNVALFHWQGDLRNPSNCFLQFPLWSPRICIHWPQQQCN